MPLVIKGFMASFGYYNTHDNNALTQLMIFIPVKEQLPAEAIASSHKRRLEDSGMNNVILDFMRAEVTIMDQENQSR